MKKIISVLILITALLISGCSQVKVNVTDKEINDKLSENFPLKKTFLVFELRCENPAIALKDGSDNVSINIDAKIGINLMSNIMPIGDGSIKVTSGLRFKPESGEIYLSDLKIDKLDIKNIPSEYTNQLTELTKFADTTLANILTEYPIYTMESKERDVDTMIGKFKLQDMKIENGRLVLTMGR